MYDVAIIGAGPAGATLARLIAGQCRVLLLEKRPMFDGPASGPPDKCCGGLLAPDAQKMLAALGLGLPRSVLSGPQLFAVRSIDLQGGIERFYQRHYINVDRGQFDRWLLSLVGPEADIRTGCVFRRYRRVAGGFCIDFTEGGQQRTESARLLVAADGAGSAVRRQALAAAGGAAAARPLGTYLAIQEWFQAERPMPYFSAVFDPAITDFYCWTIPKGDLLVVGAALRAGSDARGKFEQLKSRLRKWGFCLGPVVRRHGTLLLRPAGGQTCAAADGVGFIGEAGGWISPSSAEGFSYAFASALALAHAVRSCPADPLALYGRLVGGLRMNIRLKNLKSVVMYTPWLRRAVMRLGVQSISVGEPAVPAPAQEQPVR